jgi:DivIVA domain-containing protein
VRSNVPLTPADIHNVAFGKATIGKRGYDEEQVDALLDEVSMEMIGLLEENAELERRTVPGGSGAAEAAEAEQLSAVTALTALTAELDRARQACERAEQRADGLRRELGRARTAPVAAPPVIPPESVGRVLAMAQHTADQHLTDARRESEALLTDAEERSGQMVRKAREEAGGIERDARLRHEEAEADLETRHAGALRDIGEMSTFAEGYRTALLDQISRQQHRLDDAPQP